MNDDPATITLMGEHAEALRVPFDANQIGKLPRVTCKDCSERRCQQHQKSRCDVCKNYISSAHIHLDFVGHAAVTDRLLKVDPFWYWEPVAFADDGGPLIRTVGKETELWIRLTIKGVTRLGVGTAATGSFELAKQLISDALRNAAMRFGVALDLWSKEDLSEGAHDDNTPQRSEADAAEEEARQQTRMELQELFNGLTKDMRDKVLDRLKKAGTIARKSQGAIGTVAPERFDTVRRTLEAAHAAIVEGGPSAGEPTDEQEGDGPAADGAGPSSPAQANGDGEPMSTEKIVQGIETYRERLSSDERLRWLAWQEENGITGPLSEQDNDTLWRMWTAIEDIAAGATAPA